MSAKIDHFQMIIFVYTGSRIGQQLQKLDWDYGSRLSMEEVIVGTFRDFRETLQIHVPLHTRPGPFANFKIWFANLC